MSAREQRLALPPLRLRATAIVGVLAAALIAAVLPAPAASANVLEGVWHAPTGIDELYFTLGEEPVWATFACEWGNTSPGQSVYVVGSIPQLGNWSPASAIKLEPSAYPTWTGVIGDLPPSTAVEWKCIKRQETGSPNTADAWEPGGNNVLNTPPSGSAGITTGAF